MDAATFLSRLQRDRHYEGQVVGTRSLGAREPEYADVAGGLAPPVETVLRRLGIARLYAHQARAIERVRAGRNVVIVTGTASGKTLCYTHSRARGAAGRSDTATMLFIYPTKALAQDQLRGLAALPVRGRGPRLHWPAPTTATRPQNLRRKTARRRPTSS